MVTADNPDSGDDGTLADLYLMTAYIGVDDDPKDQLDKLAVDQPRRPVMTMGYASGAIDYYGTEHFTLPVETYKKNYETVLRYPSSVNVRTFVGGTNFGFLNGAKNGNKDDANSGT